MKLEQKIETKFGRDTGLRAPDGFLDSVYANVNARKGDVTFSVPSRPTRWQRVRPYIYLAAMFAGIWCMMKMFTMMNTDASRVELSNPPALIAEAATQPSIIADFNLSEDIQATSSSDYQLEKEVQEIYPDFQQFENEFGYEFTDEYENMHIPADAE